MLLVKIAPCCYGHAKCLAVVLAYGTGPGVWGAGLKASDLGRPPGCGVACDGVFIVIKALTRSGESLACMGSAGRQVAEGL